MLAVFYSVLFFAVLVHTNTHWYGSRGCGKILQPYERGTTTVLTLRSEAAGGRRSLLFHVPRSYRPTQPAPLILSFHGKGQNASAMQFQTQFDSPAFNPDAFVAYPQGIDKQWTGDPEAPPTSTVNDIELASDILDHIEQKFCVDTSRIYATGFSNGGGLTDLLACSPKVSARLAAVAIASGAFYKDSALKDPLFSRCSPSHVLPIMEFHGSKDPVEHYDGKTTPDGEGYPLPEWLAGWARRNGCGENEAGETTALYDGNVERSSWKCGSGEDLVVHYYIHGFGHGWPSTVPLENDHQRYGPTYFNATPVIMDFFTKHRLEIDVGSKRRKDEL